jgi:hypothetical protein
LPSKRNMLHGTKIEIELETKVGGDVSYFIFLVPPLKPEDAMHSSSKTVSKNASLPAPIYIQI